MEKYDVCIIGGGLLGCFAARETARYKLSCLLLEAGEDVCTGISRANTAIVYAGYDTAPGTLKTELCLRANASFDALCRELGVRFSRCGSLMLSLGDRGDAVLRKKLAQGRENGVEGLRLLDRRETLRLEPALTERVRGSLFCPSTGTVNPWELGLAAFENARKNGLEARFGQRLRAIVPRPGGYELETESHRFFARAVVNCAGLSSDRVRELCFSPAIRIFPTAGDYLIFDKSEGGLISRVIFHEPEEKGKGLTAVPTVDGNLLLGPTVRPMEGAADFSTGEEGIAALLDLCGELLPDLDRGKLIRSFASVRPNPFHVREGADGSFIREERGISSFCILSDGGGSFLSFIGIKTPGLSCARELGAYAADALAKKLGAEKNPLFDPIRPAPLSLVGATAEARRAAIAENPLYGRIICRCGGISEGEVLDAIARGAASVDGVKRRCGTGMGRCQGAFCSTRIMEILAREHGTALSAVTKDGRDSLMTGGGKNV